MMITLFGATGYTGRLIALVLDREGVPYRLAGRSREKLAVLSSSLPSKPEWLAADATQRGGLLPLFQNSQVLINCVGPFTDLGEGVIAQAAMSGSKYLDTTNELGFVFRARGYNQMAARTKAALVPACAFEVALADCAADIVGHKLLSNNPGSGLDRIDIIYSLGGKGSSVGTRRSAVRSLATSWITYRDGKWTGQVPGSRVQRFNFPGHSWHALSIPSCESITLPLHLPLRRVDVWQVTNSSARFWTPFIIPLFARLSRSILRPLILKLATAGALPSSGSHPIGLQTDSPFTVLVIARQGERLRWMVLTGQDPYGLTAEILGYVAPRLAENPDQVGILAPAQVVDSQAFLTYAVKNWGITIHEGDGSSE